MKAPRYKCSIQFIRKHRNVQAKDLTVQNSKLARRTVEVAVELQTLATKSEVLRRTKAFTSFQRTLFDSQSCILDGFKVLS